MHFQFLNIVTYGHCKLHMQVAVEIMFVSIWFYCACAMLSTVLKETGQRLTDRQTGGQTNHVT